MGGRRNSAKHSPRKILVKGDIGKAQCEHCGKWFKIRGLPHHQATCRAEIEDDKHDKEALAAIEKQAGSRKRGEFIACRLRQYCTFSTKADVTRHRPPSGQRFARFVTRHKGAIRL